MGKLSEKLDIKGCSPCGIGFNIDKDTEAFWNFCPHCGKGLELANSDDWLDTNDEDTIL